jgi:hypothetical protein
MNGLESDDVYTATGVGVVATIANAVVAPSAGVCVLEACVDSMRSAAVVVALSVAEDRFSCLRARTASSALA